MNHRIATAALTAALLAAPLTAARKLTDEDRIEIIRGLSAEYATVKIAIPRSKKPLPYKSTGQWDKAKWSEAGRENGPAARVGDLVQITRVSIHKDNIELEINGGFRTGPKWYERVQVGMGSRTSPVSQGSNPTAGTIVALEFDGEVPPLEVKEFKKLLKPLLDFDKHSATENYLDSLPPPIQAAIKEKRALEGMDRDQVLMALGKPRHKMRETKEGVELEDWIYGEAPGKVTFVTFNGNKVVKVKEAYAGLGGSTAEPLKPPV
ncbi:MAG: hypothetical protein R2729_24360 [Bryobacteraceae bacterium]